VKKYKERKIVKLPVIKDGLRKEEGRERQKV
jgi:hypothetical protein